MQFSLTPDLLFNTRLARQNSTLRARLETVGQEAVTGRRSDVVAATNGRVGDAFLLDQAAAQIKRQQGATNLARARLESASVSISQIRETLISFTPEARVTLETGQDSSLELMSETASDALSVVTGSLSRRQGSRHLFSGTATAGAPFAPTQDIQAAVDAIVAAGPDTATALAAIDDYFNVPGGGFDTNIYRGSAAEGPRLHISNDQSFDPIPKGDDPLLKDVMRGFAIVVGARNAATDAERDAMISAGLDLLDTATEGMLSLESRFGANLQGLDRIDESLRSEASLISSTQNTLLGRDMFDAAAELQALEGQLEASYTVTGRLGGLSLVNFLR
ncbi:MAG: flagellin [Litorimonas sp.]